MHIKKNEELFTTIKSMSGSEVRYFKIYSKRHIIYDGNNYIKLFDAIRKQTQCDDNEIRTRFKKEAFVVNLASAKHYLLKLINKSFFHYYDTDDDLSVVMRHLKLASIYHTKANYNLTEIHLKKAEKIADKKELFLYSLMISELRLNIGISTQEDHQVENTVKNQLKIERQVFEKYLNYRSYQQAYARFKTLEKTVFIPITQSEKNKYDSIINKKLFRNVSFAQSNKARSIFYELKNSYEDKRFDNINKLEVNEDLLNFYIEHPKLLGKNISKFIAAIYDYLNDLLHSNNGSNFLKGIQKFKLLKTSSPTHNAQICYLTALLQLNYLYKCESIEKTNDLIAEVEKQLSKFNNTIAQPLRLSLYHHNCMLLFNNQAYKKALKWNLKVLSDLGLENTSEVKRKAALANLLIHYKLQNFDLLQSLIVSEQRKYKRTPNLYVIELIAISVISKVLHVSSRQKLISIQSQFFSRLKEHKDHFTFESLTHDGIFMEAFGNGKNSLFFYK